MRVGNKKPGPKSINSMLSAEEKARVMTLPIYHAWARVVHGHEGSCVLDERGICAVPPLPSRRKTLA